jgi:hypothetical protein
MVQCAQIRNVNMLSWEGHMMYELGSETAFFVDAKLFLLFRMSDRCVKVFHTSMDWLKGLPDLETSLQSWEK